MFIHPIRKLQILFLKEVQGKKIGDNENKYFIKGIFSVYNPFVIISDKAEDAIGLSEIRKEWQWLNRQGDLNAIWHYQLNHFKATVNLRFFKPPL